MSKRLGLDPSVLDTLTDPNWFGPFVGGDSFKPLRSLFYAQHGVVPDDPELQALILKLTGRSRCPTEPATEFHMVKGRRAGGSLYMAISGTLYAAFRRYDEYLAPGEMATVMILASDLKQARVIYRYIRGFFDAIPGLKALEVSRTAHSLTLSNRVIIEVHVSSYRSVRGYSLAACLCDEIGYWNIDSESANPDVEVINSIRPALLSIPGAPLITGSSPRARTGFLWDVYNAHFSRDDDPILVIHADTLTLNPTANKAAIARAYEDDPSAASAEYGAQFRTDLERFVAREVVEACTVPGRFELPPQRGVTYTCFVDPSGGSSDSMTLAIAHEQNGRVIIDVVRERRAPFDPDEVVREFAVVTKPYRITTVIGDRYSGEWCRSRFRAHGMAYRVSDYTKSEHYQSLLPRLNAATIELPANEVLAKQLCGLERRTARGGRDSIDHAPKGHDDVANAVAGCATYVMANKEPGIAAITVNEIDEARRKRKDSGHADFLECMLADQERERAGTQSRWLDEQAHGRRHPTDEACYGRQWLRSGVPTDPNYGMPGWTSKRPTRR